MGAGNFSDDSKTNETVVVAPAAVVAPLVVQAAEVVPPVQHYFSVL